MPNDLRKKRRALTPIEECTTEIIGRLVSNPAVENLASLPFSPASFQKDFNAQLEKFLEQNFAEDDRTFWRKKLSLDDSQIFSDDEIFMFVKTFGDHVGIFGLGDADSKFKILSLCSVESKKHFDGKLKDFVFKLFMKTFLPKVDTSEIVAVLDENNFFTVAGVVFELIHPEKYDMLIVSIDT